MEYRTLGRTGVKVSTLCLGTMMFGPWGNQDEDDSVRIIQRAIDGGVNFVDTADVYSQGRSEEITGRALKGRRDQVVLATKANGQMGDALLQAGNSRRWIMRAVEDSLRRLDVDHIDLYQIHRPDPLTDIEETLGALTDLVRQGKVRYLGSSTFPGWLMVEAQHASERRGLERFVSEQPPYNVFVRHNELDVFPVAQRYGMGVIVWSPLAGGWLAGRYRRGEAFPEGSRGAKAMAGTVGFRERFDPERPANQRKFEVVEALEKVAADAGIALAHLAVAFTLAHPAVTSSIIGPRTMEHMEQALAGADVRLDAGVLDAIDELVPPGTVLQPEDRGWAPPWMAPAARRRSG